MPSLRYLTPFAFLGLVPAGMRQGGAWTFAAAAAVALGLPLFDAVLGKEDGRPEARRLTGLRWLPRTYVILQLAVTAWVAARIALGETSVVEAAGLTLSNGITTGVFGLSAAHELIHKRQQSDLSLGLIFLASVFYMHFRISHVYGHHRRAATFEDPATARLGEGLYAFLWRSISGQVREAWEYEARRLRRAGRRVAGPGNRMIPYLVVQVAIFAAIAWSSPSVLAFVVANAVLAVLLLETFNYVAHYGLSRGSAPLAPEHSWNSANRMNNWALFNMGRHSDHHRHTAEHYPRLEPIRAAPELPSGYAAAMLTALVPALWRHVMDKRILAQPATPAVEV